MLSRCWNCVCGNCTRHRCPWRPWREHRSLDCPMHGWRISAGLSCPLYDCDYFTNKHVHKVYRVVRRYRVEDEQLKLLRLIIEKLDKIE